MLYSYSYRIEGNPTTTLTSAEWLANNTSHPAVPYNSAVPYNWRRYHIGDMFDSGGLRHWEIVDVYQSSSAECEYLLREVDASRARTVRLGHAELNRQMRQI